MAEGKTGLNGMKNDSEVMSAKKSEIRRRIVKVIIRESNYSSRRIRIVEA